MQEFFFVLQFAAIYYMSPVGDHFVYIHVALSTTSRLPNNQWETITEFIIEYFITDFSDKIGFFFSVTDPIFTQDKQYAFIDIITYKKDKETEKLNYAYFGTTLIIYQNIKGKGWTRIKKRDYLIL